MTEAVNWVLSLQAIVTTGFDRVGAECTGRPHQVIIKSECVINSRFTGIAEDRKRAKQAEAGGMSVQLGTSI